QLDVDLGVRGVELLRGRCQGVTLDVHIAVPHHHVDGAPAAGRSRAAAAGGEQGGQGDGQKDDRAFHGSTTDRVRLRGASGSSPRFCASRIASRWTSTSEPSGCSSEGIRVAPVWRISASREGSSGPNDSTAVSGAARAIGPWRYSIAGYASYHARAASRILSAASDASPTVHPRPRNWNRSNSPGSTGSSPSSTRRAAAAAGEGSKPTCVSSSISADVANRVWTTDRSS